MTIEHLRVRVGLHELKGTWESQDMVKIALIYVVYVFVSDRNFL